MKVTMNSNELKISDTISNLLDLHLDFTKWDNLLFLSNTLGISHEVHMMSNVCMQHPVLSNIRVALNELKEGYMRMCVSVLNYINDMYEKWLYDDSYPIPQLYLSDIADIVNSKK